MALSFQAQTHKVALKVLRALWIALGREEHEVLEASCTGCSCVGSVTERLLSSWPECTMGSGWGTPPVGRAGCIVSPSLPVADMLRPLPFCFGPHSVQPFDIDSPENPSFMAWNHCEAAGPLGLACKTKHAT